MPDARGFQYTSGKFVNLNLGLNERLHEYTYLKLLLTQFPQLIIIYFIQNITNHSITIINSINIQTESPHTHKILHDHKIK